MKIRQALDQARVLLRKLDNPSLEAELLLSYVLKQDISYTNAHNEVELSEKEQNHFDTLVRRAANMEPLAYLTGQKEFFGHNFLVNKSVLIPRPETEELAELAIQNIEKYSYKRILDIGTGSGVIAISIAAESKIPINIDAIDTSLGAMKVAQLNLLRIKPLLAETKVNLIQSNIENFKVIDQYDLIVSNPPYIPSEEVKKLDDNVRLYEPHLALDGGDKGMDVYNEIAHKLNQLLRPGGKFICELYSENAKKTAELFKDNYPEAEVIIHSDLQGRLRFLEVTLSLQ